MRRWLIALTVGLGVLAIVGEAQAQNQRRRYEPRRPKFSPYLDYFRQPTGILDNFNYFEQRRYRFDDRYRRQNEATRRNREGLEQVNRDLRDVGETLQRFRPTGMSPTGKGGSFMNYSHYFGVGGG